VARQLESKRAAIYVELTLSSLANAARAAFEKLMQDPNYEYQTEYARRFFEGTAQARQEGHQEGLCEGRQGDVLAVLGTRGLTVSTEARQRILACMDPEQLQSWLLKALTATSVHELFEPGTSRSP
jgi:flagellar biosynthesis/type III secretory pathway protein FliH